MLEETTHRHICRAEKKYADKYDTQQAIRLPIGVEFSKKARKVVGFELQKTGSGYQETD
ncbi:MAG: hypothetical protein LBB76_10535 [Azoarcus sp.]|nr:hypothetical protein [Azoarcus sp.]